MLSFFQRTLDGMQHNANTRMHGHFQEDQVIHLERLAIVDENPEAIVIQSHGESYPLKLSEFQEAVKKCRNNFIFPSRTTLPFKTHQSPLIYFRPLVNISEHADLITNPKTGIVEYIPNQSIKYDADLRCIAYFGHSIHVTDAIHEYLSNGHKIAIKVDSEGNLVWLTSYEYRAYEQWEEMKNTYQSEMDEVNYIIQKAKSLQVNKIEDHGIFKNLPFTVILGYKVNLSGLSAQSAGNGVKRNTVIHAVALPKPLHEYHTADQAINNPPLCGSQKGRHFGMATHSTQNHHAQNIEDSGVTCKVCLNKLKRLLSDTPK